MGRVREGGKRKGKESQPQAGLQHISAQILV